VSLRERVLLYACAVQEKRNLQIWPNAVGYCSSDTVSAYLPGAFGKSNCKWHNHPCSWNYLWEKVNVFRYTWWRLLAGEEVQLLLILNLGTRWGLSNQHHASAALYPRGNCYVRNEDSNDRRWFTRKYSLRMLIQFGETPKLCRHCSLLLYSLKEH
jgi:hypothetical protein